MDNEFLRSISLWVRGVHSATKTAIRKRTASAWHRFYWIKFHSTIGFHRYKRVSSLVIVFLGLATNYYWLPLLENFLGLYFVNESQISALKAFYLMLSGALIGTVAIVFSLIMFAIQVNLERLPYRLFQKFSSDRMLLLQFGTLIAIAFSIGILSFAPIENALAPAVSGSLWAAALYACVVLMSYRRAMDLVNPVSQLRSIINSAQHEFSAWTRRAERARPLFETDPEDSSSTPTAIESFHDMPLAAYFQANPQWATGAQKSIEHAISFSRRYAENGDTDVSEMALSAIVNINASYVKAKGKTFFGQHLLFDNPYSGDGFITNSLEHLRQNARTGTLRHDEQQIEQTFNAIYQLFLVYSQIDYSNDGASPTHPHLAAGYLSSVVKEALPHGMTDVIMKGLSLMGSAALQFQRTGRPDQISTLCDEIAALAGSGIAKKELYPVTLKGMEQLTTLTLGLITSSTPFTRSTTTHLHTNISMVSKLFISVPSQGFASNHRTYLAPYYSVTSSTSFLANLTTIINSLIHTDTDNSLKTSIVRNLSIWAADLHGPLSELLKMAIKVRSNFTHDVISWTTSIATLLTAASLEPCGNIQDQKDLRTAARQLLSVFAIIPDDSESIGFVENWNLTDSLFEVAEDALRRDCPEILDWSCDRLLLWAWKCGRFEDRLGVMERTLAGVAALSLLREDNPQSQDVLQKISTKLDADDSVSLAARSRAAQDLRRTASELRPQEFSLSRIDIAMQRADHTEMTQMLQDIAELLSPA